MKDLQDFLDKLEAWREERELSVVSQRKGLLGNLFEELSEYYRAKNDFQRIDALCDMCVFAGNALEKDKILKHFPASLQEHNVREIFVNMFALDIANIACFDDIYDSFAIDITSIITRAKMQIESLGFDFYKCLDETYKEIASRTGSYDENQKKWVKDTSPEAKAKWYKADYERCKTQTL